MSKSKTPAPIYQIKVTLRGSKPPIWRRLLVSSEITLATLHDIIQIAMGWDNSHLHAFEIAGIQYSEPVEDLFDDLGFSDEGRVKLSKIVPTEGFSFRYEYDFGDSWDHIILVEKMLPADPPQIVPVCITGKRACPPEDVGGVWGYDTFLKAIKNPDYPDHDIYTEWIGDDFDSEAFDLDTINAQLHGLR
jgi:hypothetical protein